VVVLVGPTFIYDQQERNNPLVGLEEKRWCLGLNFKLKANKQKVATKIPHTQKYKITHKMTTSTLSALQVNNQGVSLLLEGRDQEGVRCLSQSLSLIKSRIGGNYTDEPMSIMSTTGGEEKAALHEATFPLPNFEDAHSFLYTAALAFSADCDDSLINESNSHVYSAVVIFNLALAYHRQGKKLGKSACLVKAERMYEMVIRLLDSEADYQGTALLVKLATLNNLSLLHHEQRNYESAQNGFELLAWTIRSAPSSSMLSSSQMDVDAMLLNVLFVSVPSIAPAA
jgi:hypothetical protein